MQELTATYSPEDNKLRLYASSRLDADLYQRVKDAGFSWAPRQGLFVAPMWTPARADLAIELCGEIGDEDTTLAERADDRAERFEGYQANRAADADRAREAVQHITDGIPLGQPILVGHHSEARARRDAKKIEAGMQKAVDLWETSEYWKRRARGAVSAAKYKERPDVRYRRIKGLEADARKHQKTVEDSELFLKLWGRDALTDVQALAIASREPCGFSQCYPLAQYPRAESANQYEGSMSLYSALKGEVISTAQAVEMAQNGHKGVIAWAKRWLTHIENRITYEREMLGEQGGLKAESLDIQVGGRILLTGGAEWFPVTRVTKRDGQIVSVSIPARYVKTVGIEQIAEYRAPTAEESTKATAAKKLAPMCNYPGEGFLHMTKAEWAAIHDDYKGSRELGQGAKRPGGYRPDIKGAIEAGAEHGRHRVRSAVRGGGLVAVYLTDSKRTDPPKPEAVAPEPVTFERELIAQAPAVAAAPAPSSPQDDKAEHFKAIKEALREGVQAVSAPQLFPTPISLARRMVALADIRKGDNVLEPESGTARILAAIRESAPTDISLTAVEIRPDLCATLQRRGLADAVFCSDFLDWSPADGRRFDKIVMNPPFSNGQDIKHIQHGLSLLAEGGELTAICANGPHQNEVLRPLVEAKGGTWEVLPAGSFNESGTGVNAVLLKLAA